MYLLTVIIGICLILILFLLSDKKHLKGLKEVFAKKIPTPITPILTAEQVCIIKSEIKHVEDKLNKEYTITSEQHRKEVNDANSICPKCKSTKVNDRIKRIQGEINGLSSGSFSGGLFGGSGFSSGSIHGEMDTNEVNVCNECNHEWKKVKLSNNIGISYSLENRIQVLVWYCRSIIEYNNCTFDPLDAAEKFSSLEEKKAAAQKSIAMCYGKKQSEVFNGVFIETIQEIANQVYIGDYHRWEMGRFKTNCTPEILEQIGYKHL